MEKYFLSLIALIVTTSLTPFAFAGMWSLEGRFVSYASLCDFDAPELSPRNVRIAAGTEVTITGCLTLEAELQQPLALIVKIQNSTDTPRILTLPFPSNVIVHKGLSSKPAFALYYPWVRLKGWATEGIGRLEAEVKPNAAIELLYLIPQFSGEALIELVNIGSFKITFYPPWDVNQDGIVDTLDLVMVGKSFGREPPYPKQNPDVNRDNIVDISDLVLVARHFGERGDR